LAGFIVKPGIIKIESKNKRGRPTGGLFHCPPRPANGTSDPGEFRSSPGLRKCCRACQHRYQHENKLLKNYHPKKRTISSKKTIGQQARNNK
jgi:hypothetical protein